MNKILAINGSYRVDGMTDQAVLALADEVESLGAEVEIIFLRNYPIEFCLNCRECTQMRGENPGHCVLEDGMEVLVNKIEAADGYILASPTNFGATTAMFQRFMERLVVYAYWPWNNDYPKFRKEHVRKKQAILISSCAAPSLLGRFFFDTRKQLKMTAQTIGANAVGTLFTGTASQSANPDLPWKARRKISKLAQKLMRNSA